MSSNLSPVIAEFFTFSVDIALSWIDEFITKLYNSVYGSYPVNDIPFSICAVLAGL